jgi:hypothetical protein
MFCKFGSCELSLPVDATVWLNEGMQPTRLGFINLRQGIDVGALQLADLPVFEDLFGSRCPGRCVSVASFSSVS